MSCRWILSILQNFHLQKVLFATNTARPFQQLEILERLAPTTTHLCSNIRPIILSCSVLSGKGSQLLELRRVAKHGAGDTFAWFRTVVVFFQALIARGE